MMAYSLHQPLLDFYLNFTRISYKNGVYGVVVSAK